MKEEEIKYLIERVEDRIYKSIDDLRCGLKTYVDELCKEEILRRKELELRAELQQVIRQRDDLRPGKNGSAKD